MGLLRKIFKGNMNEADELVDNISYLIVAALFKNEVTNNISDLFENDSNKEDSRRGPDHDCKAQILYFYVHTICWQADHLPKENFEEICLKIFNKSIEKFIREETLFIFEQTRDEMMKDIIDAHNTYEQCSILYNENNLYSEDSVFGVFLERIRRWVVNPANLFIVQTTTLTISTLLGEEVKRRFIEFS